ASKQQNEASVEDVTELLDTVDVNLERVKTLYEQYFLGIQKQPPTFLHSDIERKLRDLTQLQVRNTGLRYRLATIQQKFGSYNSYWRRTLRQIENGTYLRNLSKIGREAIRTGADIPEEILAAMPKRMREQVQRDRDKALAIAKRRTKPTTMSQMLPPEPTDDLIAMIKEPTDVRRAMKMKNGAHVLEESDGDIDIDAFFDAVRQGTIPPPLGSANVATPIPTAKPPPPVVAKPGPVTPPKPIAPVTAKPGPITPPLAPVAARPATGGQPAIVKPVMPPPPPSRATGAQPAIPSIPKPPPTIPSIPKPAASQTSRPNPIAPGAAAAHGPVGVESVANPGERDRFPTPPQGIPAIPRQTPPHGVPAIPKPVAAQPSAPVAAAKRAPAPPPQKPPPGMTDADVNALYAKYVKAKEMVGEKIGPGEHGKLLKTINQQAPKIMEQYKAKGVDFSVVVKDNQVIIRAKPKT
ncbi:MAG TPA: MXAN_5187 C-terminal domain-containing protein, partial [Kofleriaceae bacterium]